MTRTKSRLTSGTKSKKVLKLTKGFIGSHSKLFTVANQQNMRALRYSYCDRRKKKGNYKNLWVTRMNATARMNGKNYSFERYKSKQLKIIINRKMISEDNLRVPCVFKPITFNILVIKIIKPEEGSDTLNEKPYIFNPDDCVEYGGRRPRDIITVFFDSPLGRQLTNDTFYHGYYYLLPLVIASRDFNIMMKPLTFNKYKPKFSDVQLYEEQIINYSLGEFARLHYQHSCFEVYDIVTDRVTKILDDHNLEDPEYEFLKDKIFTFLSQIFDPFMTQGKYGFITGKHKLQLWVDRSYLILLVEDMVSLVITYLNKSGLMYTEEMKNELREQIIHGFIVRVASQVLCRWEITILAEACLKCAELIIGTPGTERKVCRYTDRPIFFPTCVDDLKSIDDVLLEVLSESICLHFLKEYKTDYLLLNGCVVLKKKKYRKVLKDAFKVSCIYFDSAVRKYQNYRRYQAFWDPTYKIGNRCYRGDYMGFLYD